MTPRPSWTATSAVLRGAGRRGGAGGPGLHRRRVSSPATGSPSGRRTASSGRSPRSACTPPGRSSSRSTPGSRAPRRRTSSARPGPGCCSPSPTSSTPTTSRCSAGVERPRQPRGDRRAPRAPCADGHHRLGRLPRPGRRGRPPRPRPRGPQAIDGRRPLRHPLHLGHDRAPQGGDAAPRRRHPGLRRLVDGRRPARGRPLPHRQPVLPRLRLEGGHPRLPHQGRHDRAPPRVRRARR